MSCREKILQFIAGLRGPDGVSCDRIDAGTELVKLGLVDSFNTIEIVAFLETEFGIRIDSESLRLERFKNVEEIARLVESLQTRG